MNFMLERQNSRNKIPMQKLARTHQIYLVVSIARNWLHYVNPRGQVVNRLFPTEEDLWAFLQINDMQAFVPSMTPLYRDISAYAKREQRPVFVARSKQFLSWVHYVTETGVHKTRCFPSVEDQEIFMDDLIEFEPDIPGS